MSIVLRLQAFRKEIEPLKSYHAHKRVGSVVLPQIPKAKLAAFSSLWENKAFVLHQ